MKRRYAFKDYPDEFNFRCKCIVVFQNLDGVDVILFGLYVYEHDKKDPLPNRRCVYVSYLDSVHFMRPRYLRTFVYHEILISYLDYVRGRGFATAHIWACPPLKGDDYILYAKPEDQKTPKDDRLRQWYIDMLVDCQRRGIVGKVTNMFDLYFSNVQNDATVVPYMDGDYFPAEVENIIKDIEEGKAGKKGGSKDSKKKKGNNNPKSKQKKKSGRGGTRSSGIDEEALKASGIMQPDQKTLEEGGRDYVMVKLGETIKPMKESFIVAFLAWDGAKEEDMVVPKAIQEYREKNGIETKWKPKKKEEPEKQEAKKEEKEEKPANGTTEEPKQESSKADAAADGAEKPSEPAPTPASAPAPPTDNAADNAAAPTPTGDSNGEKESDAKEEAKSEEKEETKDDSKEESKGESKEDTKDESKEDAKEESKDESKEESKEEAKEESKDTPMEEAKEDSKDTPMKDVKEESTDTPMKDAEKPEEKKPVEAASSAPPAAAPDASTPTSAPAPTPAPAAAGAPDAAPASGDAPATGKAPDEQKQDEKTGPTNAVSMEKRKGKFASMARKRGRDEESGEEKKEKEPETITVKDSKGRMVKVLDDDAEEMDCEFLNNRQAFLNLCQGNHYQFDQLRRAKHSSMMVLWHLHNRDAPKFVQQCATCSREILQGYRFHCPTCADFDQCQECVSNPKTPRHPHQLKPIPVSTGQQSELTEAQRKERQRSIQLHMTLLLHADTCQSPKCPSANCTKMKGLLKHGAQCQVKATGGCNVCKRIWALLQIHARQCKASSCPVPNCMAIRERVRQLKKQQQAMDDRRRQEMNRAYRGVR